MSLNAQQGMAPQMVPIAGRRFQSSQTCTRTPLQHPSQSPTINPNPPPSSAMAVQQPTGLWLLWPARACAVAVTHMVPTAVQAGGSSAARPAPHCSNCRLLQRILSRRPRPCNHSVPWQCSRLLLLWPALACCVSCAASPTAAQAEGCQSRQTQTHLFLSQTGA